MSKNNFGGLGNIVSFDVTILTKKVEGIKAAFENGSFADALVGAVVEGQQLLVSRSFDEHKDIQGNDFGVYIGTKGKQTDRNQVRALFGASKTDKKRIRANAGLELTSYQRKRANKGRQILKKDLQFMFGLRKSIETQQSVVNETEKSVVLEFNNDEAAKIARGQENQITNIRNGQKGTTKGNGIKIFRLNESEKEKVIEKGTELIKQILE